MSARLKTVMGAPINSVVTTGPMTFSMIEKAALLEMDQLIAKEPTAARILNHLIRLTEPGTGGVVVISRATLAAMLGVSDPTVGRAIRVLVEGRWVQRLRVGGAYALAVNTAVAWTGPRGDMERAVFKATVVASRTEQDADALSLTTADLRRAPTRLPGEYVLPVSEAAPPAQEVIPGLEHASESGAELKGADLDPETQAQLGQVLDQLNASAAAHGRPGHWKEGKDPA